MFGKIFLVIYIILQVSISLLTEYALKNHKAFNNLGKKSLIPRIVIYVILAVVPVLGAYLPKCKFKFWCMQYGNLWLGFLMFYSAFVILLVLILFVITKIRRVEDRSLIGHALHFAFIIALILTICGLVHAQNPKLKSYDILLENESAKGENFKIVLLGDLHLSVNSDVRATEKMVEIVNSAEPDIIVIAGDIFTSNYAGLKHPEKYSAALSKMRARYGVYAVCGNHDVDENLFGGFSVSPISEAFRIPEMEKFFEDAGFKMLYDEEVSIEDGLITLVGRIDGEKAGDGTKNRLSAGDLLKKTDKKAPVIVLEHEPIDYKNLAQNGADLILSGHTHNGQIFPGNLIIPAFNENAYGVKELYGITTVVTAGVGYYGPPVRLGTDSEVTLLNVKFD
ncbi:hypothetical protein SAMN06297422_11350 [Lachnospiraceae bacterium]|nr:hypothetical protein SAMN06297422_11350 [Lachnospiraceae bacterium]